MAKISALVEAFSAPLDSGTWTFLGDAPDADVTGGVLHLPVAVGENRLESVAGYDLSDSSIFLKATMPTRAGGGNVVDWQFALSHLTVARAITIFYWDASTTPTLQWTMTGTGGFTGTPFTHSPTDHAWLKIALAGTSLTLQGSPDGVTWTTLDTRTTTASNWTNLQASTTTSWGATSGSPPVAEVLIDNVNVLPPAGVDAALSSGGQITAVLPVFGQLSSGTSGAVQPAAAGYLSSGGQMATNVRLRVTLSSGGGATGGIVRTGPGDAFRFGMSGRGVPDLSVNAYLPDDVAIAGTWTDTSVDTQTHAYNLAPGGEYEHWTGALDWAFGGIFPATGDTWAAAAAGAYLARWRTALETIRDYWVSAGGRDASLLRLRFAHEANGSFSDWAVSSSNAPYFRDAYKLWADLVASVLPGAWRMQSFNYGTSSLTDVHDMLVTGRWADALSVDYYNAYPHASTGGEVTAHLNATSGPNPVGVEKWRQLAAGLGLPLVVSEWGNPAVDTGGGAGGGDAPLWMQAMLDFFHANAGTGPGQVAWGVYFNFGTAESYPANYLVLPPGSSAQSASTAVLTGASSLSIVVGGAVNNVAPTGTSTATGAVGTGVVVGWNDTGWTAPPPPVLPTPGAPGAYPTPSDVVQVKRISDTYPDPTFVAGRIVGDWQPSGTVVEDWGTFRLVADGQDITYLRGGLTTPDSIDLAEPFGEQALAFSVSHLVPTDVPGTGDLSWLRDGASIDVVHLLPGGGSAEVLYSGEIIDFTPSSNGTDWTWQVQCVGALMTADLAVQKPPTFRDPTDMGKVVADTFNTVVSRAFSVAGATTGILTTKRGSADSTVIEFVQELLSTSTTSNGLNQWTVARTSTPRAYQVRLKDRTTQHWTIHACQPGVEVNLSWDASQCPNVIYGRGVRHDGYAWANWVFPNQGEAAPAYPFAAARTVITVGTTDASTVGGNGVSTWQQQVNDLAIPGAKVTVDGVYSAADAAAAKVVQRSYGILVDGIVGPQTWAATFDVGANGASLDGAKRLPLYWDPLVEPYYYTASGAITRPSLGYSSGAQRREIDINFGDGVTKAEGSAAARALYLRDGKPGWAGTVTLKADPQQGSMFAIREGQNIRLRGWGSPAGPLLHIAAVSIDPVNLTVTLTVDEKARDLATLVEVMKRNKESATNPARLPAPKLRHSRLQSDNVVEFDGESVGGKIPRIALYGGLWTVIRVPVSQVGTVAKIEMRTVSPASEFTVAFFGAPVTAAQLLAYVGANPLTARSDHFGPYDWAYDQLVALGFQEAIGGPGQAAGYDPGYQTSPVTGGTTPLTGRLISTGSWTYQSVRPPWLWIALWAKTSCFISGRIYPQPVTL